MSEPELTIVVSAGGADERMLRTCLCALERHKGDVNALVLVVAPAHQASVASRVCDEMDYPQLTFDVQDDNLSGSKIHAEVLDRTLPYVVTPYILTLDADCFPMSSEAIRMMLLTLKAGGVAMTGITQPYAPPPDDMAKTGIEYRIRNQLSCENIHVACMMIAMSTLKKLNVKYSDGDDTGMGIVAAVRKAGLVIDGWNLTGCAKPGAPHYENPEFNRESGLIYGESMMYHHGGGSREIQGRGQPSDAWRSVRAEVFLQGGAEFLSDPDLVHRYQRDREEEVADVKVRQLLTGMQIHLQSNEGLFKA